MTNEVKGLRDRIFGKKTKFPVTLTAIEVMKVVGGYEQFKKLPITTFNKIVEALEYKAEMEEKAAKKAKRNKR